MHVADDHRATADDLVRELRERHGLTQRQLAVRAGTTQSAISRIERGVESPTVHRLAQILLSMGVHLDLRTAPMDAWADPAEVAAFRALPPPERLHRGIAASRSASQMQQAGIRQRNRDRAASR